MQSSSSVKIGKWSRSAIMIDELLVGEERTDGMSENDVSLLASPEEKSFVKRGSTFLLVQGIDESLFVTKSLASFLTGKN